MEHEQGTHSVTREATIDALGIAATAKATYAGGAGSVVGFFMSSQFGVIAGVLLALLGFLANLWFQHRRDKREAAAHEKYMASKGTRPGELK